MRKELEQMFGIQVLQVSQPQPHGKPTFWIAGSDCSRLRPLDRLDGGEFSRINRMWLQRLSSCLFLNIEFDACTVRGLFETFEQLELAMAQLESNYSTARDWSRVEASRWKELVL